VIHSFADKRTKKIFEGHTVKRLDGNLQKKEGNLKDYYAIWVNSQWRIIFKWIDGSAHDVELIDYH